ncbi:MAG: glycoside hydrolase family 10 protein [Candidatus Zipacnadales bacterium]
MTFPLLLPLLPIGPSPDIRPPVVVVEGDYLGPDGAGLKNESHRFFSNVCAALDATCVDYETSKDSTVERWGLPQTCRVAMLPYNRAISMGELAQLQAFLNRGGKLIIFYVGPEELLLAVGIRPAKVRSATRPGEFVQMRFRVDALPTLPHCVTQTSWNVRECTPLPGALVLGNWYDSKGVDSGLPAVVLAEQGAFISHVFANGDEYRKGQVLRALIGHFAPTIWPGTVRRELEQLNAMGKFGTLARLRDYLQHRADLGQCVNVPLTAAQRALALRDDAQRALANGDALGAVEASTAARLVASEAFWGAFPSKPGELRGVWMSYHGRPTWDETMRRLREANLNAVMPRFCSAAVAYFPSRYLPESTFSKQNGDQLAQAAAAAQKYGISLHARMLALFIYEAPPDIVEMYRKAGRLMMDTEGKPINWLCPTNPQNRQTVIGACLEMARYPVAGLQLDYIRYPWSTSCYCPTCKAKFQQDLGVSVDRWPFDCSEGKYRGRFANWRREQITSLVREIRNRVKDLKPELLFSADVFVNWEDHRNSFGQDWKAWVDEGLLDFACPMDYFKDDEVFASWVTKQRAWTRWETPMCVGIGPRVEQVLLDPQRTLDQIELSRRLGGDGWVLFEYDEVLAAEHLPILGAGVSSTPSQFSLGAPYVRCAVTSSPGEVRLEYELVTDESFPPPLTGDTGEASLRSPKVAVHSAKVLLYTSDAWLVLDLGPIMPNERFTHEVQLPEGSYRLCVQGTCTRPGGRGPEFFVRWGQMFNVRAG